MSVTSIDKLLETMGPRLTKQHIKMRNPICVNKRLTITIR